MNSIVITTPKTREDVIGIKNVHYKTWLATYPNKELGITIADVEEKFKNRLNENNIEGHLIFINDTENKIHLIAKDGDTVVGICDASIHDGVNELNGIYVLPEYHGMGIGKKFWDKCLEFFNPEIDIILYVASYNNQAISFYENLGFISAGDFEDKPIKMPISGAVVPITKMILRNK